MVIAAPHTPRPRTVPEPQFEQMKRDAVLINIGRGAIVRWMIWRRTQPQDRGGGPRRVRDRAAAGRSSAVADAQRDPHAARGRVFGQDPERHLATLLDNIRRFSRGEGR